MYLRTDRAGMGTFRQSERGWGGGTGPGRGKALGPLWVARCLLLSQSLSLWTCTSRLTFACRRQSSDSFAFVEPALFTPLRLVDRTKVCLFVRFCFGTAPAPCPSPTPPQKLPQHFTHAPQKRGPLGPCCCPCEPAKFHIVDRSPPGKTVPCPSSSPQATHDLSVF
jgi:hypothetical protein